MSRSARIASASGCYHLIIRGNDKQTLFKNKEDLTEFTGLIEKYFNRCAVSIYHYCLMHNHVHLLVGSEELGLIGKLMHGLQRSYHHYYRRKYTLFGHLMQGRYRSFPIEDDSYLLECGRYIERNPVRAGIVDRPEDWDFSSYKAYAWGQRPEWLTYSPVFLDMHDDETERQVIYRERLNLTRPYEELLYKRMQRI